MADRQLTTVIQQVYQAGIVPNGWNSATFINMGSVIVTVNDMPLIPNNVAGLPGASIEIAHNQNEVNTGEIKINFPSGTVGASCYMVANYYKDKY